MGKQTTSPQSFYGDSHGEILRGLDRFDRALIHFHYEGKPNLGRNIKEIQKAEAELQNSVLHWFLLEHKTIYPFVKGHLPRLESALCLLESEQRAFLSQFKKIRECVRAFKRISGPAKAVRADEVRQMGILLIFLLKRHLESESRALYAVILKNLNAGERTLLRSQIERARSHGPKKEKRRL
jgi:hypothetical protein